MQNPFLFDPNCSLWLQFKEHLRVLGKENSLYPLKPVINCLCLTKFELKQTLNTEKNVLHEKVKTFFFITPLSEIRTHFCPHLTILS